MAAKRRGGPAVGANGVAVEVRNELGQAGVRAAVPTLLPGRDIAGQRVDRLDRSHAVPLAHDPGPRDAGQGVRQQIADEGRDHVQRAAGMALRQVLEGFRRQGRSGQIHPAYIGHVRHQPHAGARQPIGGGHQTVDRLLVRPDASAHETLRHVLDPRDGVGLPDQRPIAGFPRFSPGDRHDSALPRTDGRRARSGDMTPAPRNAYIWRIDGRQDHRLQDRRLPPE